MTENWDHLYRLAFLLAGRSLDADDLLQDTLVKAIRSWPRVEHASSQLAYVRKIMATTAIDSGRRVRRGLNLSLDALSNGAETSEAWENALVDGSYLWSLIAELPTRQRAVIVLRYYEDLSERQIAAALGCRPGTVKSQASAALRRLGDRIQAEAEGTT